MDVVIRRAALLSAAIAGIAGQASAHGFAGDRFFPATLQTDDPFVADEMSLPTVIKNPTDPTGGQSYSVGIDIAKRLTHDFGLTAEYDWNYFQPKGAPRQFGFGSLSTGAQYQLFVNAPHEMMALVGLNVTWAHTGAVNHGGADDHTTLEPTLDFGKGFGDLPDALTWLRPVAITGNLSVDFPTKVESNGAPNANNFNYGFAIEYSLEYLQHHVKDIGIGHPFDHMIPLVEVAMTTPLNRGLGSQTTGTVQPGLIWSGQYYQVGGELIVPINSLSGHGIGGVVQFHLYLDDIFPRSIGRPLFGS